MYRKMTAKTTLTYFSFSSQYWPLFVLFFYILSPIPYCIARRLVDDTDAMSNACKELAIFLTTGIVVSAFGLPIVFARAHLVSEYSLHWYQVFLRKKVVKWREKVMRNIGAQRIEIKIILLSLLTDKNNLVSMAGVCSNSQLASTTLSELGPTNQPSAEQPQACLVQLKMWKIQGDLVSSAGGKVQERRRGWAAYPTLPSQIPSPISGGIGRAKKVGTHHPSIWRGQWLLLPL